MKIINPKLFDGIRLFENGNEVTNDGCASLLNRAFHSVFTIENLGDIPARIIDKLNLSSSSEFDKIEARILKNIGDFQSHPITHFFSIHYKLHHRK